MKYSSAFNSAVRAAVLGFLALGLSSTSAFAATATANFNVTATVSATCIVSATALSFGSYTGAVANAQSSVNVTCTNTSPYDVGLNAGLTTGATVTTRQMGIVQPAGGLNYGLFSDSGHATNWGNTAGSWVHGVGSGAQQTLTVYGQVPAGQYVTPGSYTDTIIATVNY